MIAAKMIADSICNSNRITTMVLTYQRFVHEEFMTHRIKSRNSASSRAIPAIKNGKNVLEYPAFPERWLKNCRGMQGYEPLSREEVMTAREIWDGVVAFSVAGLNKLADPAGLNCHKQHANRLVQNYSWMHTIVTATNWENFFFLRDDKDAAPEMQELGHLSLRAYLNSEPTVLEPGEWHIPYGDRMPDRITMKEAWQQANPEERDERWKSDWYLQARLCVSAARCARLSYLTHDGVINPVEDFRLHGDLIRGGHWTPLEHQAEAMDIDEIWNGIWNIGSEADAIRSYLKENRALMDGEGNFWWGPLCNWRSYRKRFSNECRSGDLSELYVKRENEREGITV